MSSDQLTPTQRGILAHAAEHTDGKIVWFPESLKGSARQKLLDSLARRNLIAPSGDDWFIAAAGYQALGTPHRAPLSSERLDEVIEAASAAKIRTRENSKQAEVIRMLGRPEGATIAQICAVTGWQAHTVRGALAGALKKKLGLAIVSDKLKGGERTYRIA